MALKNLANKTRRPANGERPYEIWNAGTWTYVVLKKNQAPDKEAANPYAIWNVGCVTPYERSPEVGRDTYATEVKAEMRMVWIDPDYKVAQELQGVQVPPTASDDPDGWKRWVQ